MTKIFIILLLSFNILASDCLTESENLDYPNLHWVLASKYNVYSSVINIEGILCVGFSTSKQIARVHYFDDLGTKVLKSSSELMNKDVVFFSRSVMPSYAKVLLKKIDPMTLSLKKISDSNFQFRLTFVQNMMRSFRSARVREIKIDVDTIGDTPLFKSNNQLFDEFIINVNKSLSIYSVKLLNEGELIINNHPSDFRLTRREY
jgi:hypothetical protein